MCVFIQAHAHTHTHTHMLMMAVTRITVFCLVENELRDSVICFWKFCSRCSFKEIQFKKSVKDVYECLCMYTYMYANLLTQ